MELVLYTIRQYAKIDPKRVLPSSSVLIGKAMPARSTKTETQRRGGL